ncbi:MAG: toxic anion resistance protein [Burkholderiales bacterium]|nr:toxic anion resistance protein [Burkholderiales bacterium]
MDERSLVVDSQNSLLPQLSNAFTDQQKINIAAFSDAQRQRVAQIVAATGELDSAAVTNFGTEQQMQMNRFLDELLVGIRTADVGEAGAITLELARHIKTMKLAEMKAEVEGGDWVANSLGKLPLIGKYASALRYFQLNHAEIIKYLKEIEDRAQRERGKLAATNGKLDQLVERTIDNIKQLELYLAAGQSVLMRAKARFADKQAEARVSNDQVAIMKLRDEVEQINAFEARLLRMHIGFTDALLSVPQIRLTQEAARIEERNIMDTILFDLPRLKSAILRVASLKQIMDASAGTEARREITRQVGAIGGDLLQQAYTQAKQSQGSGAEDVALLAQTADKLLETIALGVRLDEENRQKRKVAENQLGDIKVKLLEGLRANTNDLAQRSL